MQFINPYHFIPLAQSEENKNRRIDIKRDEKGKHKPLDTTLLNDEKGAGHHKYYSDRLSGCIKCTLTTKTPTVIGNKQSSEAGEKRSVTKVSPFDFEKGVPAIPGTTLRGCVSSFAEAVSDSALRVLDNAYYSVRVPAKPSNDWKWGIVVEKEADLYVLPLGNNYKIPKEEVGDIESFRIDKYNFYYALIKNNKVTKISEEEFPDAIRGVCRVLQSENNKREFPDNNKSEYFFCFSPDQEKLLSGEDLEKLLTISEKALKTFSNIAKERESENSRREKSKEGADEKILPYQLRGYPPFRERDYKFYPGEIVYYKCSRNEVSKIQISQIWREEIPKTTHDFFSLIDKEILPFTSEREALTPAELLFGFVEDNQKNENPCEDDTSAFALAGRVRFSNATVTSEKKDGSYYHEKMTLKNLESPKPPCPCFYFKKTNENSDRSGDHYICKKDLGGNSSIVPQGVKQYVRHAIEDESIIENAKFPPSNDYKRERTPCEVTPIKSNVKFSFDIKFDNLTEYELGLLLYSLVPSNEYLHKIGMAKPLGFGSVKVSVASILLKDRIKRYGTTFSEQLTQENLDNELSEAESRIICECREIFESCLSDKIKKAVGLLGAPQTEVHYPKGNANDSDSEFFRWFVANDKQKKCGLVPLDLAEDAFPTLPELAG